MKKQKKLPEPHLQFRPQSKTGVYVMKSRRKDGEYHSYNLRMVRNISPFAKDPLNRQVIGRMFGHYHYYDGHAPEKVSESQAVKQRRIFWNRRMHRHGGKWGHGTSRVSSRGINSWL